MMDALSRCQLAGEDDSKAALLVSWWCLGEHLRLEAVRTDKDGFAVSSRRDVRLLCVLGADKQVVGQLVLVPNAVVPECSARRFERQPEPSVLRAEGRSLKLDLFGALIAHDDGAMTLRTARTTETDAAHEMEDVA